MRRSELTNKIFGRLTVVGLSEISRNGHSRWFVKCECGTEKTILGTHLISGNTISCGCYTKSKIRNTSNKRRLPRNFKGFELIPLAYYNSIKRGASGGKGRKPIPFNISIEEMWDLYKNQDGYCKLSKLPIDFISRTASLDRINSAEGYNKNNCQWLHKDINMMKRHYTENYFKYLCTKVSDSCEIVDLT